ncbi:MAG: glycoside hydrolase [Streptosporangiaceae bacterium]|nr:glycoside hydrolase [Streptosporangiaceae bacterium]
MPDRDDGFVPIEAYAALGDGRTVALVALDGRVDWWPLPTLDSPPGFAAIIDPANGGHLALAPEEPCTVARRYLPDTNVLETRYATASGEVRVLDALAVGRSGRLPWSELIRTVEGVTGAVVMRWEVSPGTRFESVRPWTECRRGTVLLHVGDQHMAVRPFDVGEPVVEGHRVTGTFTTAAGSRSTLAVTSSDKAPVFASGREDVEAHLKVTVDRWREWSASIRYDGRWAAQVRRSAVALKLLLYTPTGAVAAAPTTSLPERIGGDKNWDYRYMWVRDTAFTADALISLGLYEEVQATVNWLLGTVRRTAPELHVFYKLDGSTPGPEATLDARGYRGSRPVRAGNGAAHQSQLGCFGDLFDTVWHYVRDGHLLDPDTGRMLADLADRCCDLWMTEDAGIWELHTDRHYTISKMGCWTALDRAVRLAGIGEIPTQHAGRWGREAAEIRAWVNEHCWSARKNSYTLHAGTEDLDAATLIAAQTGFDRGKRLAGTVAAVRRELARGPLVYRYTGMEREEGCFLACTFWLVSALAELGELDDAHRLMDQAVALGNDVGLLAEEMDPDSEEMLGNFPQALSHLALINAAVRLDRRAEHPGTRPRNG